MKTLVKMLVALATSHWLVMTGAAITTGSAVVFVSFLLLPLDNPYLGMLLFLGLPAAFAVGLLLIPVGLYLRAKQVGGCRAIVHPFAWGDTTVARLLIVLTAATGINVALLSTATSEGVEYMESARFCGQFCHGVMEPQYTAYLESAHAEVGCVSCHVGPDTSSFLYHKLDGLRQSAVFLSGTYSRPVPSDGGRLHAASETCGTCHVAEAWPGEPERLRIQTRYGEDESSSEQTTVLLLHTARIHEAHRPGAIRFLAEDPSLGAIPWVSADGVEYVSGNRPEGEPRTMDCMDCHNRVGHDFRSPAEEIDRAITRGELLRSSSPYVKRDALAALNRAAPLPADPQVIREIRARTRYPEMRITSETYPSQSGHESAAGCFRCHDYTHESADGAALSQDCSMCHTLLAIEDPDPDILRTLGIEP